MFWGAEPILSTHPSTPAASRVHLVCTSTRLRATHRLVPLSEFNTAQTLCFLLEGLLVSDLVGTKDASRFEIYFVRVATTAQQLRLLPASHAPARGQ